MVSPKSDADDGLMTFLESSDRGSPESGLVWRVLVVDDEPDMHEVTRVALREIVIEGRRLEFVHAYSAAEARTRLDEYQDLAVILLDVVMESDDAGLQLVRHIRNDQGNQAIRIILRTGQPGFAPEIDTIQKYDINDYKTKSELTRVRLFTSLTVAIRSYSQINQLEANRHGLELIVEAGRELSKPRGLHRFAEGVVTQLCALLGVSEEGVVCAASESLGTAPYVLAAAGRYSAWISQPLIMIPDERVRRELTKVLTERCHSFSETTCLYFSAPDNQLLAVFVEVNHPLGGIDRNLLEVFCNNIAAAFENVQLYDRISALAYQDTVLKLPNRNGFIDQVDRRSNEANILAMVDIDDFADINSILDQDFGDAVLSVVAQRLRCSFPPSVAIARIGGDLFGLLGTESEVNAHTIGANFIKPFKVGSENLRLSATTGLVQIEDSSSKAVELLKNAGAALKQAKSFNRGQALFFSSGHSVEARERMQLLSCLRQAFSTERLFLVYQPLVDLANDRIVGAEALLRWRTEQGEFIAPDRFIPLAEQSGLMVPVGDWVTRSALKLLKRLVELGHQDFRMAINVSQVQFREPDFVEKLIAVIDDVGVNPRCVEIELTESVAIDNIHQITQKLSAVSAAGMTIAIDDFGTGYSSLNILRQLKADRLKIDRSFVSGDDSQHGDYSIAAMILKLAEQLGLETIAEGIETQEQREKLLSLGCGNGQGYLFSKPITEDRFVEFLQNR